MKNLNCNQINIFINLEIIGEEKLYIYFLRVMLTSDAQHWLRIQFRKVLISLLWEMKRTVKILITFFSFSIKTFFN